jgi:hypothetical protein
MDTLLSMPVPMSSALMILIAIAAFMFIKVIALIVAPDSAQQKDLRSAQHTNHIAMRPAPVRSENSRSEQRAGRRNSDTNYIAAN